MATGNLAPIIPALFTGPNGERLTADQIKRRQEVAESLMAQATDSSPNAGGWASILGKVGLGLTAGYQRGKAERGAAKNAEASSANIKGMLGSLLGGSTAAPTMGGLPAAASTGVGAELAGTAPQTGGGILPSSFLSAVDRSEGAGAYDTLFGHAQKNGPFAGTSVSSMPISDVLAFADPSGAYGQHVKGQVGRVATPMGRYQIVGTTLKNAVGELGLDPSTPFNAQTQDTIAAHLARRRIASADSMDGKISALRSEWEGFRSVPNDQMRQIVADLESGASSGPVQPVEVASLDPAAGYQDTISTPNSVAAPAFSEPPRQVGSMQVASALAAQPAAATVQPQIAQATMPPINPAVIETLTSPYASADEKAVAQAMLGQYQSQQQAAEKRALAEQQRAAEIARRQQIAQQAGIDPNYASDDDIWKAAAGNIFAAPSTSTVNGAVVDNRTREVIYQAPVDPQTYQGYADYERSQGRTPLGPLEYEQALRRSGASQTNVDTGTIPTGYRAVRDEQGRVIQYEPIPGGPAAMDAETLERTTERQAGARETASRVVTDAATRALEAMQAPGLPATGVAGGVMSWLPESNAAELRRQVDVLKSNATVENLNAMRAASPTGGALGSVTEKEGAMLAAKSGTLDPNSPNFARDVKDYTRTLLEVTHGPKVGKEIFDKMRWPGSGDPNTVPTDIPGVKIRRKAD